MNEWMNEWTNEWVNEWMKESEVTSGDLAGQRQRRVFVVGSDDVVDVVALVVDDPHLFGRHCKKKREKKWQKSIFKQTRIKWDDVLWLVERSVSIGFDRLGHHSKTTPTRTQNTAIPIGARAATNQETPRFFFGLFIFGFHRRPFRWTKETDQ